MRSFFIIRGVLLVWMVAVSKGVTLEELESLVSRHSQALRQISPYLVRTDQFWRWYTRSHRRLNAMMTGMEAAAPATDGQLEEMSQRLRLLEAAMQGDYVERQVDQLRRLQILEETVARLTENMTETNRENEALRREIELGSQDTEKLLMFVRQMSFVSNNTGQLMKEQVRILSERVVKMEENVAARIRAPTEKETEMMEEISHLKQKILGLEEDHKLTTEVNTFLNNSVTSINEEIRNITDTAKQFPAIESKLTLLRDKMESFESAAIERTLREARGISESKMRSLEEQLNSTRDELTRLQEETYQLRLLQENAGDTRNEIVKMKDELQNLHAQSQNTRTRFVGVQRSVESQGNEISGIRTSVAEMDGRLDNISSQIDGMRSTASVTQRDMTELKDQVESIRTAPPGLEQLRDKVAEIEKKVEAKSVVRVRGNELLNSITAGTSAIGGQPPPVVSNALEDFHIQNLPG